MAKKKTDEPNGPAVAEPAPVPPPPETNGNGGTVIRVFSYPVAKDTVVQALVKERKVSLNNGGSFTAHEVCTQKVWTNPQGEKKTLYTYRCSELYALLHAIQRAEAYILDLREEGDCPL